MQIFTTIEKELTHHNLKIDSYDHTRPWGGFFVIVNSDHQRSLKQSKEFQLEDERMLIVSSLKPVDKAILSIDNDRTVCQTIASIAKDYGQEYDLAFANGGDQNNTTIPERPICEKMGIALLDGLGDKIQSSSWLLKK